MKKIKTYLALIFSFLLATSCKDYLDVQPENVISEDNLEIEELVVNAYSALDYRFNTGEFRDNWPFDHAPSNWAFSDIRSGDAYKGGGVLATTPAAACMRWKFTRFSRHPKMHTTCGGHYTLACSG